MNNLKWSLELITPDKARELLKMNKVNRPVSKGVVQAYAIDMKNGRWDTETTSCIALTKSGELKDGQHRLNAVILAGIPVLLWICRGVGEHVVFDSGRNRQASDYMKIEHPELEAYYHNNKALSVIKFLVFSCREETDSHLSKRARVSQHEIEDFIFLHKVDFDNFFGVIPSANGTAKLAVACVYLSLFMAYKGGVSLNDISHFFSVLTSGMSESQKDFPIIAYRNYLLNRDSTVSVTTEEIRKCQGALMKYLTGSCLKRIYDPKKLIWDYPYITTS